MNIGKYLQMYSEELQRKGYRKNSIDNYLSYVKVFLEKHNHIVEKPSEINEQHIKTFLGSFSQQNTQRAYHSAIKCFYKYVGKQPNKFKYIEYTKRSRKLPIVLSSDEVKAILDCCQNTKHKAIIMLLYSCGLRIGEVINLKLSDIDSKRMVIYIRDAKGGKDRQVPLHQKMLDYLRLYYKEHKPKNYLFNGQTSEQYTEASIRQFIKHYADKANIQKRVYPHLFRHSSFTNLIENGVDVSIISKLAGHGSVKTTMLYTHISSSHINKIYNPLQSI
jgi:site-specific recombinase XerD